MLIALGLGSLRALGGGSILRLVDCRLVRVGNLLLLMLLGVPDRDLAVLLS